MGFKIWFDGEKKDLTQRFIFYPKRRYLVAVFVTSLLFWCLFQTWSILNHRTVVVLDRLVVDRLGQLRTPFFNTFFLLVTNLGSLNFIFGLLLLLVIFLVFKRRKRAAFVSFIILILSIVLVFSLKDFFARPRPNGCLGTSFDCFSFPSGHATLSFYFYGLVGYLLHRFFFPSKKFFILIMGFSLSLVILIAASRVYLGFHYISDLVGGFLLGGILLSGAFILVDLLYR